jgi:hypothetical protein
MTQVLGVINKGKGGTPHFPSSALFWAERYATYLINLVRASTLMAGNGKDTPRVTAGLTGGKICPGRERGRSRSEENDKRRHDARYFRVIDKTTKLAGG